MNLILIPLFSTLNALRGAGKIDRISCAFGMAFSVELIQIYEGVYLENSIITSLIVFFGMWIGLVCGWGKYLNILSGNMQYVNESEVKPIDWLTTKICGFPTSPQQFVRWCFVAMTLRGLLFYPLFLVLSLYNHQSPLWGIGCTLMGCVYYVARLAPIGYQVRTGEALYGALLGWLMLIFLKQ